MRLSLLLASMCSLVLVGCGSIISTCDDGGGGVRLFGKNKAEQKLDIGVREYQEGNYLTSMEALKGVLETNVADKSAKVNAYKYLAFIHCISSQEVMCKGYFSKVLELDPEFELTSAEAGHPIWGPVFRSVKNAGSKASTPTK